MQLIITAEIDEDEIDDVSPDEIVAQLRNELDGYEFWTPASHDSIALFRVKVTVNDDAMVEKAAIAAQAKRAELMPGVKVVKPWDGLDDDVRQRWLGAMRAAFLTV